MIKKILILSDSHGNSSYVRTAIEREKPDMLIHLGDVQGNTDEIRKWLGDSVPAVFIEGNCDRYGGKDLKAVSVFELNGHRFFCTHGHRQGVSLGIQNLIYTAMVNECDIALYGHTHVPLDDTYEGFGDVGGGVRVLNPGSIALPRGGSKRSYMVMTFDENEDYEVELRDL
ncbi:MAG: metallophosphoesterase [Eubacterium sp.]|nr:metallophosphoesterase [Eubacterium sp.]